MKLSEFIKKLGTFPPDDIVRFYCPVDNIYRTIWHISYSSLTIEMIVADDKNISIPVEFFGCYYHYANTIKELTKIGKTYPHSNEIPITIIDKRTDKLFSIIQ
jgi:hypothetical protein